MSPEEKTAKIKQLWQEAFGDSDEFIDTFLHRFHTPERMYTLWNGDQLLSMLHLLPFSINGTEVGYIYGVATSPTERGRGHATRILKEAIEQAHNKKLGALVTIPADESLRHYYAKFGFTGRHPVLFKGTGDFDLGTGESSKDLLAILPLNNAHPLANDSNITLEWQELKK